MAARKAHYEPITRLLLLSTLVATGIASPALHALTHHSHRTKPIDTSDDSGVVIAQKRLNEAVKALAEAESTRDKTAIETAQKEKDAATKALQEARESASAAAKEQQKR